MRLKIDEKIEPRIKASWECLSQNSDGQFYNNWKSKLEKYTCTLLHQRSVGYSDDLHGLLKFWTNLMNQELKIDKELVEEVEHLLSLPDMNRNYESDSIRSPGFLVTPRDMSDTPVFDYKSQKWNSQDKAV
jgi:hypothetical protein